MWRPDAADRAYLGGLALGLLALQLLDLPRIWLELAARNDFAEYWVGSRAILEGGDPYDPARWSDLLARHAGRVPSSIAYPYPPYVAVAVLPFALLPIAFASALWTGLGVVLAALALRALLRAWAVPPAGQVLLAFTLLTSQASLVGLAQGQASFLLTAALAAAVAWQASGREVRAAAATLALAAKPQVSLLAGWSLVAGAVMRGQRAFLLTLVAGGALVLASVVAAPRLWTEWWAVLAPLVAAEPPRIATLLSLFDTLLGPAGRGVAAALAVALVLLTLRHAPRQAHPAWFALSLAAAPYAQRHDQVALVVPLAMAVGALARESRARALALCGIGVVVLIPVAAALYAYGLARGGDPFGVLVPLALFVLVVAVGGRR